MKAVLTEGVAAYITQEPLAHEPRFSYPRHVSIGPYTNGSERDAHIGRTFGSMQFLWGGRTTTPGSAQPTGSCAACSSTCHGPPNPNPNPQPVVLGPTAP